MELDEPEGGAALCEGGNGLAGVCAFAKLSCTSTGPLPADPAAIQTALGVSDGVTTVYPAPEAQRPDLTAPRAGPPRVRRMVLNDHPPLAIAPQKTAARTAQRTVRERRNGTRVRRIQLVEDGEDVTYEQ